MHIGVLGIGSVLMGDDAVGPYAVELLRSRYEMPENVELLDVGTPGIELFHTIERFDALIVVDSVRGRRGDPAGSTPGAIRLFRREELLGQSSPIPRMTPHEPSLVDALLAADFNGQAPEDVVFLGVVPAKVELGTRLSPAVQGALPRLEEKILAELGRLGQAPRRRETPEEPRIWWEKEAA